MNAKGVALAACMLAAGALFGPNPAAAHPVGFGSLSWQELPGDAGAGQWNVLLQLGGTSSELPSIALAPATNCEQQGPGGLRRSAQGLERRFRFACTGAPSRLGLEHLPRALQVQLNFAPNEGASLRTMLDAQTPNIAPASPPSATAEAGRYLMLGVEHILVGWDHLAFVGLLMLLLGMPTDRRDLLRLGATITAFSLGHSVTLAWAALTSLTFDVAKIEVLIALSIVLLAVEAEPNRADHAWARRHPGAIAGLFGLVHGLGFASVLGELGLPEQHRLLSLVSFNLGVELGQLAVVAAVLLGGVVLGAAVRRRGREHKQPGAKQLGAQQPSTNQPNTNQHWVRETIRYALGTAGAFALIQRIAGA